MSNEDLIYINALEFAAVKHKGQERKGGIPYIVHPVTVARMVESLGLDYALTGLFHDLIEDTDATEDEILALSNDSVLEAVKLLSKTEGYNMKDYIIGIKSNNIAFEVKKADRLHNLISAVIADDKFKRKYIKETIEWYWDFSQEIREATRTVAATLSEPMSEYDFLYKEEKL